MNIVRILKVAEAPPRTPIIADQCPGRASAMVVPFPEREQAVLLARGLASASGRTRRASCLSLARNAIPAKDGGNSVALSLRGALDLRLHRRCLLEHDRVGLDLFD